MQFHLQAKKLHMDPGNSGAKFAGRVGTYTNLFRSESRDQCTRLINLAGRTCIPGYVFYNGTAEPFPSTGYGLPFGVVRCPPAKVGYSRSSSPAGCTCCPAEAVLHESANKAAMTLRLAEQSMPWEWLLPPDRCWGWPWLQGEPRPGRWGAIASAHEWLYGATGGSGSVALPQGCSVERPIWMEPVAQARASVDDGPPAAFGISVDLDAS